MRGHLGISLSKKPVTRETCDTVPLTPGAAATREPCALRAPIHDGLQSSGHFIGQFVYLSLQLFVSLPVCLFVCLSLCLFVSLPVCLFVTSLYLSFFNPLIHGLFSNSYFKVLWEGGDTKFLDFFLFIGASATKKACKVKNFQVCVA